MKSHHKQSGLIHELSFGNLTYLVDYYYSRDYLVLWDLHSSLLTVSAITMFIYGLRFFYFKVAVSNYSLSLRGALCYASL